STVQKKSLKKSFLKKGKSTTTPLSMKKHIHSPSSANTNEDDIKDEDDDDNEDNKTNTVLPSTPILSLRHRS
ncbi:uncharacterized protein TRUGW13939_07921, partial [Talaromyces rugulosus]